MIRLAIFLAIACAIFGVGAVLGAGDRLLNKTADALESADEIRSSADCERPEKVVDIGFSKTKYPRIRAHMNQAIRDGWPRELVLNRKGADGRRDRALEGVPTRAGYDRDEYPPAVGRRRTATHVRLVPSSESRSHGATMGVKLRRYCDGTRFRYVFY